MRSSLDSSFIISYLFLLKTDSLKFITHFIDFAKDLYTNPIIFTFILLSDLEMDSEHGLDSIHIILLRDLSI